VGVSGFPRGTHGVIGGPVALRIVQWNNFFGGVFLQRVTGVSFSLQVPGFRAVLRGTGGYRGPPLPPPDLLRDLR